MRAEDPRQGSSSRCSLSLSLRVRSCRRYFYSHVLRLIWTNLNLGSRFRSKLLFRLGLASDSQLDLFLSSQYYLTLRLLVYLTLLVYTYLTDYGYARRYRTDSHSLGTFAEEVPLSKCHATAWRAGLHREKMGRIFTSHLEGRVYSCKFCKAHLASVEEVVSKVERRLLILFSPSNRNGLRGWLLLRAFSLSIAETAKHTCSIP